VFWSYRILEGDFGILYYLGSFFFVVQDLSVSEVFQVIATVCCEGGSVCNFGIIFFCALFDGAIILYAYWVCL